MSTAVEMLAEEHKNKKITDSKPRCAVCGKGPVFRQGKYWFCSYTCWAKWLEEA